MPIIIKKGSESTRHKHRAVHKTRNDRLHAQGENRTAVGQADISSINDMTDVLDLKVYRVSKPNFADSSTTTKLIGEMFYDHDDVAHNQKGDTSVKVSKKNPGEIALVDKLRNLQIQTRTKFSGEVQRGAILQRIKETDKQMKLASCGKPLRESLNHPELKSAVAWAIQNVRFFDEDALISDFLKLASDMQTYETEQERSRSRCSTSESRDRSNVRNVKGYGLSSTDADGFATAAANELMLRASTSNKRTGSEASNALAEQLEALKKQGESAFERAVAGAGESTSRQHSSRGHRASGIAALGSTMSGVSPLRPSVLGNPCHTPPAKGSKVHAATKGKTPDSSNRGRTPNRRNGNTSSKPDIDPGADGLSGLEEVPSVAVMLAAAAAAHEPSVAGSNQLTFPAIDPKVSRMGPHCNSDAASEGRGIACSGGGDTAAPSHDSHSNAASECHTDAASTNDGNELAGNDREAFVPSAEGLTTALVPVPPSSSSHGARRNSARGGRQLADPQSSGADSERREISQQPLQQPSQSKVAASSTMPSDAGAANVDARDCTDASALRAAAPAPAPASDATRGDGHRRAAPAHSQHRKLFRQQQRQQQQQHKPVTYSNAVISAAGNTSADGRVNAETQEAIAERRELKKAFQKSVGYTMKLLNRAVEKTDAMQAVVAQGLSKFERTGMRIMRRGARQHSAREQLRARAMNMCDERDLTRPVTLRAQLQSFSLDGREDRTRGGKALGVSLQRDLQHMRVHAEQRASLLYLQRFAAQPWFGHVVGRLCEYMRRLHNSVPICCLKFLLVIKHLLKLEFEISRSVFYCVLEATVEDKADFMRSVVHHVLKAVRAPALVNSKEFLKYHEDRDIKPCPELLGDIALEAEAAAKANRAAAAIRAVTSARASVLALAAPAAASKTAIIVSSDESAASGTEHAVVGDYDCSSPSNVLIEAGDQEEENGEDPEDVDIDEEVQVTMAEMPIHPRGMVMAEDGAEDEAGDAHVS